MYITRIKNAESGEVIEVDIETLDAQMEMEVRAKRRGALLGAIGRYAMDGKTMPSWLARAVCSPWGRSVIANVITQAEDAGNPNKRG
jgi:hypothetical protein